MKKSKTQTTRTAAPAAKTTTETPTAAQATASADHRALWRDGRKLSPLQAFICDEVADMLIDGGDDVEVTGLLRAALGHAHRRYFTQMGMEREKVAELIKERTDAAMETRLSELASDWQRNYRAEPEDAVEPATASERIRAGVIYKLTQLFESFVASASPFEHLILSDVLVDHEGTNIFDRASADELPLAEAMMAAIGEVSCEFTKIPAALRPQVEKYIECLQAAEAAGEVLGRCA